MTRHVNERKTGNLACPECGSMLEFVMNRDRYGKLVAHEAVFEHKRPVSDDDEKIEITKKVSRYESQVVGVKYRHVCRYRCPECGVYLSDSQVVKREFSEDELPFDYYISDEPCPPPPEIVELMRKLRGGRA